jgi:hypothetical protein
MPQPIITTFRCGLTLGLLVSMGCSGGGETAPPPRTAAAFEQDILLDDPVGISTTAPVRRAPPQFDDADADAIRLFYDVLAPYGSWSDDARLGLVWTPARDLLGEDFARSFVPYATHGRWTYREGSTEGAHEYVWVSDLPWGWVTFHYGRWAYTGHGWAWVAGRRYAGAWVDWRTPGPNDAIVGWGPMPPSLVWRVAPEQLTRARLVMPLDPRHARLVPVPYAAFATPYVYARSRDLFAHDLGSKLLAASAALAVAHTTDPGAAPSPDRLGFRLEDVPSPPPLDRGLQQAWMLATPASASAVGQGPELPAPPRLRTWVAGGPRWSTHR